MLVGRVYAASIYPLHAREVNQGAQHGLYGAASASFAAVVPFPSIRGKCRDAKASHPIASMMLTTTECSLRPMVFTFNRSSTPTPVQQKSYTLGHH